MIRTLKTVETKLIIKLTSLVEKCISCGEKLITKSYKLSLKISLCDSIRSSIFALSNNSTWFSCRTGCSVCSTFFCFNVCSSCASVWLLWFLPCGLHWLFFPYPLSRLVCFSSYQALWHSVIILDTSLFSSTVVACICLDNLFVILQLSNLQMRLHQTSCSLTLIRKIPIHFSDLLLSSSIFC